MTIREALIRYCKKLKPTSFSPELDTEVLLSSILKKDRTYLWSHPAHGLTKSQNDRLRRLVQKRSRQCPVAYLTGHKEFFGLDFRVTPNVLVPRPDTETLVELALQTARTRLPASIVDIGTGSGNVIISLAKHLTDETIKFYAIDSSIKALAIARLNARRHGIYKKIKFRHGSLLSPLFKNSKLEIGDSLLLANLPYLTPEQYAANPDLRHEPKMALIAGPDGWKYFRQLFKQSANTKLKNSVLLLEHDPRQKHQLATLAKKYLPKAKISFFADLGERPRVMKLDFKS